MRQIVFVFVLLISLATVHAGTPSPTAGKQAQHLTGNPSVDFFSHVTAASASPEWNPRAVAPYQESSEKTGDEKSPWIAGFLSLAVPGAGEVYTHSYVKAGIFAAAEVASILMVISYNHKGDDQTAWYEAYADQHYNAARYARWTQNNLHALNPNISDTVHYHVFNDNSNTSTPPYNNMDWAELNRMESDVANLTFNGYTHRMPGYPAQQYYELIGKYDQFSTGWDEADTSAFAAGSFIGDRTAGTPGAIARGQSQQRYYMDQRALSNHYYDVAGTYAAIIVVNHLLSAVDAYWSATRYNHSLHASVDMKLRRTQYGLVPIPTAHLSYNF